MPFALLCFLHEIFCLLTKKCQQCKYCIMKWIVFGTSVYRLKNIQHKNNIKIFFVSNMAFETMKNMQIAQIVNCARYAGTSSTTWSKVLILHECVLYFINVRYLWFINKLILLNLYFDLISVQYFLY